MWNLVSDPWPLLREFILISCRRWNKKKHLPRQALRMYSAYIHAQPALFGRHLIYFWYIIFITYAVCVSIYDLSA